MRATAPRAPAPRAVGSPKEAPPHKGRGRSQDKPYEAGLHPKPIQTSVYTTLQPTRSTEKQLQRLLRGPDMDSVTGRG